MWSTALTILHIVACIFLVVVVLLQTGKGTDVNAVFGGSSQTIFGSSGAGNFLTRLTTATAAIFMATSLFLTYGVARQTKKSIFDDAPAPPAVTTPSTSEQVPVTPTTPEQTPATPGSTSGTTSDKPVEAPVASQTAPIPAPSASAAPTPATTTTPSAAPADTTKSVTVETKSAGDAIPPSAPTPAAPATRK